MGKIKLIEGFGGKRCQAGEVFVPPLTPIETSRPIEGTRRFTVIETRFYRNDGGIVVNGIIVEPAERHWFQRNNRVLTLLPDEIISLRG